jgi:hypothetical protein
MSLKYSKFSFHIKPTLIKTHFKVVVKMTSVENSERLQSECPFEEIRNSCQSCYFTLTIMRENQSVMLAIDSSLHSFVLRYFWIFKRRPMLLAVMIL